MSSDCEFAFFEKAKQSGQALYVVIEKFHAQTGLDLANHIYLARIRNAQSGSQTNKRVVQLLFEESEKEWGNL